MAAVIKLHDMESAAVHVKMDIPLFKVRGESLPDLNIGISFLDSLPCGKTYTLAVFLGRNEKQVEFAFFTAYFHDRAADFSAIKYYA